LNKQPFELDKNNYLLSKSEQRCKKKWFVSTNSRTESIGKLTYEDVFEKEKVLSR
jgi:hypothetical protein